VRLFWTESHITGDRDTGKRRDRRRGRGPAVDRPAGPSASAPIRPG